MTKTPTTSPPEKISLFKLNNLKSIPFTQEKSQVQKTREDVVLTVKEVLDKIGEKSVARLKPILLSLGENTTLCRLFFLNDGVNLSLPKIYIDEEQKLFLFDANSSPKPINIPLEFSQYTTEFIRQETNRIVIGEQIIKVNFDNTTAALAVPIGLEDSYIKSLIEIDSKGESIQEHLHKGKGVIPSNLVKYYPRPYKPNSQFEKGESYQILEDLGNDPRYDNAIRYRLQQLNGNQPVGEPFEVLANYSLQQHWKQFGSISCTVIDKVEKERGFSVKFAMSDLAQAG